MTTRMSDATYAFPVNFCVGCHVTLDHATNTEDNDPPTEGQFTLCVACGALMVFTSGLGLAPAKLLDIPVLYRARFARAIYLIRELRRKNQDSKN